MNRFEPSFVWATVHSTRKLADRALVGVAVGAAAVLEVAGDRVVVVAVDRRDAARLHQRADVVRVQSVADEVAAAVDRLDPKLGDPGERGLERRQVGVNVGDDGDALAHAAPSRDTWSACGLTA
jgi:hypothetical protein